MVNKTSFIFLTILFVGMICMGFVLATHTTNPTSFIVNPNQEYTYSLNISVSEAGQSANVSQINITLPSGFAFKAGSNATSALGTFLNASNVSLSWTNATYLINGSSSATFSFIATSPSTSGAYNFTVISRNGTSLYSANISVLVNDSAAPYSMSFVSPTPSHNDNLAQTNISVNVSAMDNSALDSIRIYLWGSSGLVNNTNFSVSGTANYSSINFTGLSEGEYSLNISANDSRGNENLTSETRTINLYNNRPVINLIDPSDPTTTTLTSRNFTFTVWAGSYSISSCSLILDGSVINRITSVTKSVTNGMYNTSLSVANHTWSINCTANGVTSNSSSRTLRINPSSDDNNDDDDSDGGNPAVSYWFGTFVVTDAQLREGYTKEMQNHYRLQIRINNTTHYVGIVNVSGDRATINVSSTPQQAVLYIGESKKFEVTGDYYYDVLVSLLNVSGSKAKISVKYVHDALSANEIAALNQSALLPNNKINLTNSSATGGKPSGGMKWWMWMIIGIIIVAAGTGGVLYYLYLKNLKKIGYK